jgi:PAS domain S-box-containing protein
VARGNGIQVSKLDTWGQRTAGGRTVSAGAMMRILVLWNLSGIGSSLYLMGSGLFGQETATPTTIVGAFIFICLSVVGLMGWLIRHLLTETLPNQQKFFAETVDRLSAETDKRLAGAMDRIRDYHAEAIRIMETGSKIQEEILRAAEENTASLQRVSDALRWRTRTADAVASTEDGFYTKTLDGVILTWNNACQKIFGWKPEEVIGHRVSEFLPQEAQREEDDILARVRRGEAVQAYETTRLRKGGERITVEVTVSPIRESTTGKIAGASSIVRPV